MTSGECMALVIICVCWGGMIAVLAVYLRDDNSKHMDNVLEEIRKIRKHEDWLDWQGSNERYRIMQRMNSGDD